MMLDRFVGVALGGAIISGAGAFTLQDWMAVGGFLLAVGAFVFNIHHKREIRKIEREKLERQYPQG